MTEHRIYSRKRSASLRRPVTALTTLAMLCQALVPAYGQIVTDPAAGVRQPQVDHAANGTPVVNITTPNASGVSHNVFTDFNVGTPGVVLNNSAELSASQIAGLILGNTNLVKGQEATLILNEVTGTNRSQLSGYLEVSGRAASVIVANPNGITCSGCGFINMPRATLTTGRPVLDGAGNVTGFNVTGGSIVVGADGLDATRLSRFELISRAIEINGALQAQELTVSGGRQTYDYASGTAKPLADDGAPKPQFFLDGSALGGMYANRIRIVGNELGLGIRAPKLGAAAGDLSVEAQGHVILADASATGAITIRSTNDTIDFTGKAYSGQDLSATAAAGISVSDGALAGARGKLALAGQSLTLGAGTIAAGLAGDGTLVANTGSAQLRFSGVTTIAAGGLLSGGDKLDFTAGSITNAGIVQADSSLTLGTTGDLFNDGRLLSSGDVQLHSGHDLALSAAGTIEAGRDLDARATAAFLADGAIRADRDATLSAGSLRLASLRAGRDLVVSAQDVTLTGSVTAGGRGAVTASHSFALTSGATLGSVGDLTVTSDAVKVTSGGQFVGNSAISIATGSLSNDGGTIVAGADLTIAGQAPGTATGLISNISGQIGSVAGDTRLTAQTIDNRASILAGRDLIIAGAGINGSASGSFEAGRDLSVSGAVTLSGALRANRNLQVSAGTIATTQLTAGQDLSLAGVTFDNLGNLVTGGTADLHLTTSVVNRAGSSIAAGTGLTVTTPLLDNAGTVSSQGSVTLAGNASATVGELDNRASGRLAAGTTLTGTFATLNNAGLITSAGNVSFTGNQLTNAKEITADGAVALRFVAIDHPGTTSGGSVTIVGTDTLGIGKDGVVQATNALAIQAGTVTNLGLLASGGTLLASVGALTNDHAAIIAKGDLTIGGLTGARAGSISNLSGDIESVAGNISLAAERLDNIGDGQTALQTTEIRHQFITGQKPPPDLAYYPDLISRAGYFQLYDEGRTREYVFVPSPEEVNIILAAEGITIDQWTPTLWQKYAPDPQTFDPTLWAVYIPDEDRHAPAGSYVAARDESDVIVKQNEPGQIITGKGNIRIDAGVLQNTQSTISANGDIALTGGSVLNEGKSLAHSYSLMLSYNNGTVRGEGWVHPNGGPTEWFAKGNPTLLISQQTTGVIPSTITATGTITGNLSGSFVNIGTPATDPATLSFANTSTTLVTVMQAPPATSVGAAALAATSGTGAGVMTGTTPLNIPASQLMQFAPANANSRFVIETRLPFINPADYFGSDYFFDRLGFRPDAELKALGDAYFDFLLIRDQILDLTGQRLLDRTQASEQAQTEALIARGADLVKQFGLKVGTPLSAQQQAALTEDVVIYEETTFKGQRVLVPHLYLSNAHTLPNDGRSARINAQIIDIASAILINNNGTIGASDTLRVVSSGDIAAAGGRFSGSVVDLSAGGTLALAPIMTTTGNGSTRIGSVQGVISEVRAGQALQLKAPTISVAGSRVVSGGDINIEAQRLDISPAEAFAREAYSDKKVKFDVSRNLLLLSNIQAAGSININATDTAFIRAATLTAGNDVRVHAGELFIASGQEKSASSGQFNKSGFTKSTTQWDSVIVTQVPSVVRARNAIEISTTYGDLAVTASILDGPTTSLQSAGQVRLETAYNERFESNSKQGSNLLITSSRARGTETDTVVPTEIYADQLSIRATKGVVLQFRQADEDGNPISLNQAVGDLAQFKGLSYLQQLRDRPDVQLQGVEETFKSWNHHQVGLSGPAAAVVVLALSLAIPNPVSLSQLGLSGLSGFSGALVSGSQVALSGLVKATATTFLTSGGDVQATLRSIGSNASLKALATTVVTAGALEGLDQAGLMSSSPETWLGSLKDTVVTSAGRAVVSTAINGGSLAGDFKDELIQAAAANIGEKGAFEIGCAAHGGDGCSQLISDLKIDAPLQLIAHIALGCATGALAGDCRSGAIGAGGGELGAKLHETISSDQLISDLNSLKGFSGSDLELKRRTDELVQSWIDRGVDAGRLSGALLAWFAGGNVDLADSRAETAVLNNNALALPVVLEGCAAATVAYPACVAGGVTLLAAATWYASRAITDTTVLMNSSNVEDKGASSPNTGNTSVTNPESSASGASTPQAQEQKSSVSDEARQHILEGDEDGGGGHRAGTGRPAKSEFPPSWSDDKIIQEVEDIANDPSSETRVESGGRIVKEATRDGVKIRVVIQSNGQDIITAYPPDLPRNSR